jgi:very-short-patch-repair endonuclease
MNYSSHPRGGGSAIIHSLPRPTYRYSRTAPSSAIPPEASIHGLVLREPHYRGGYMVTTLLKQARALRQRQTRAEELLWQQLRGNAMEGLKFRRQHQFGRYICDFYCHAALLAIECDGGYHNEEAQLLRDHAREAVLSEYGVTVLRFTNEQVCERMPEVLAQIRQHIQDRRDTGKQM